MAFAMMAVFSLAFVSCGDDDEDDITSEATIVGTWEVTENNFSTTIKEIAGFEINEIEVEGLKKGDRITFFENGTYRAPDVTGTWSKTGNTLKVLSDPTRHTVIDGRTAPDNQSGSWSCSCYS